QPGAVELACAKSGASIVVDGRPWPELTRDGARVRMPLRPGLHVLRVEKLDEELASADTPVLVRRGAATVVEPARASLRGVVHASWAPPGARVSLAAGDGRVVEARGATPVLVEARAGRWTARFELPGFPVKEIPVDVRPGGQSVDCAAAWDTGSVG